ncbi:hypothetical protein MCP_1529 [Methanocella paludicola SANAE]|uniref:DUF4129 domain-containing protein n=1 Tax=Methanocella paludicola (strain DSM 17711 / JCM 13418 / NBRC 101707 / SANAE) TaxID=304371 RepID=D1YYS9_METPS|nr:hypothetical protein [Methanocella paludicola]BAI61601.1 hypothetical protein MCP_1529 [Methanocella paludicola SANAE]
MKNKSLLLLALALVFISIIMLAASIDYSSGLIGVRSQPQPTIGTDINITGQSNRTDDGSTSNINDDPSKSDNGPDESLSSNLDLNDILKPLSSLPDMLEDPPDSLLLWIILLILLILLAMIGYILWRRYRRRKQSPVLVEETHIEARPMLEYFEGDYKISFPQIRAPLPAIWGAGDKLNVLIQDKAGKNNDITLYVDGNAVRNIPMESGSAQFSLDLDKGDHRIKISPKNVTEGSSWADVRIVEYREEVVRMFNEMYQGYRSGHNGTNGEMTARELEIAMRQGMPEDMQKRLGKTITLFEYANYSLHDIRRGEFEEMYMSQAGLVPATGGNNVDV